jgi:hypothetical protein
MRKTFIDADDFMAAVAGLESHGANRTVDPWRGTTTDEDSHAVALWTARFGTHHPLLVRLVTGDSYLA